MALVVVVSVRVEKGKFPVVRGKLVVVEGMRSVGEEVGDMASAVVEGLRSEAEEMGDEASVVEVDKMLSLHLLLLLQGLTQVSILQP